MKPSFFYCFILAFLLMTSNKAFAYDIAVENDDGVIIYYNYYNNGTELEVTYKTDANSYLGSVNIPETVTYMNRTRSVTSIGNYAFHWCSNLTNVAIPSSVTSIGQGAFAGCSKLNSVTIPSSVTSIGQKAFYDCTGLTSVTIPSSVTSIGQKAFYNCSCTSIKVSVVDMATFCNNQVIGQIESVINLPVTLIDSEGNVITGYVIPEGVETIGADAFRRCTGLNSVTILEGVTSIGSSAFWGCTALTTVTIPSSVTSIDVAAFEGCLGLKKVIVSDIAAWCGISFVLFSSNPLHFAHHLYSDKYTEIKGLVIPSGVTSIGYDAFDGCTGLTSVTIPSSVTSIGQKAFYNCSGLTSVTIPESVTSIGGSAFAGCSGLTSVTIPLSVTSIGDHAFSGNNNLTTVISLREEPFSIPDDTFSQDVFMNADLFIPVGTMDKYKSKAGWKNFLWMQEGTPSGISTTASEMDAEKDRYTIDGKRITEPSRGLNIIRMSDGTTKKFIVK